MRKIRTSKKFENKKIRKKLNKTRICRICLQLFAIKPSSKIRLKFQSKSKWLLKGSGNATIVWLVNYKKKELLLPVTMAIFVENTLALPVYYAMRRTFVADCWVRTLYDNCNNHLIHFLISIWSRIAMCCILHSS